MSSAIIGGMPWQDIFDFLPAIVDWFLTTWESWTVHPAKDVDEPRITKGFYRQLLRSQDSDAIPFHLHCEVELHDLVEDEHRGDIDFTIKGRCVEADAFFGLEAKCLNVQRASGRKSNSTDYVQEGMLRFVEEKYRTALPCAAMIGYVMDGDLAAAMESTTRSIKNHADRLKMNTPPEIDESALKPGDARCMQTVHNHRPVPFTIHHLFLVRVDQRVGSL